MSHEVTLTYTIPLLREAVFGFWRRSVGRGTPIALAIFIGLFLWRLLDGDRSWGIGALGAALVFAVGMVVAVYFVHYANTFRKFRDMGSPQAVFKAEETSFTVSSGASSSTVPWSMVTEVWQFKNCWLLLFSKAQFMTIPLSSVSEEFRAFVLQRIVAAGGKVSG